MKKHVPCNATNVIRHYSSSPSQMMKVNFQKSHLPKLLISLKAFILVSLFIPYIFIWYWFILDVDSKIIARGTVGFSGGCVFADQTGK